MNRDRRVAQQLRSSISFVVAPQTSMTSRCGTAARRHHGPQLRWRCATSVLREVRLDHHAFRAVRNTSKLPTIRGCGSRPMRHRRCGAGPARRSLQIESARGPASPRRRAGRFAPRFSPATACAEPRHRRRRGAYGDHESGNVHGSCAPQRTVGASASLPYRRRHPHRADSSVRQFIRGGGPRACLSNGWVFRWVP